LAQAILAQRKALSSGAIPSPASMAAPAPPPPPPPPQPDLNAVYRPDDDPDLQNSLAAPVPGAGAAGSDQMDIFGDAQPAINPVDLFGEAPHPAATGSAVVSTALLDLDDSASPSIAGAEAVGGQGGGLFSELPPGVSLDKPAVIDLSAPGPTLPPLDSQQAAGPSATRGSVVPTTAAVAPVARISGAPPSGQSGQTPAGTSRPIPRDSQAFGSDDLFGNGSRERSIREEAVAALAPAMATIAPAMATIHGYLPEQLKEQLKQHVPDCMAPVEDPSTEEVFSARGHNGEPSGPAAPVAGTGALEEQHTNIAVDRAVQGRWVPTYMRQQLVQNGHTQLPSAPNAHEYDANAPPPNLGDAFAEMGQELGETAQTMLTFMIALISSLSLQCQMCSHSAASTVHEQVVTFCENPCGACVQRADQAEEVVVLGRPLDENAAGLGPVRSRLVRSFEGLLFSQLVQVVKSQLVTAQAPPQFKRAVRSRELARQISSGGEVEDWLFNTEVNVEAVPPGILQNLGLGPMEPFNCREIWHIEGRDGSAQVEISTVSTTSPVILVIRLDIAEQPGVEGGFPSCQVDSRLYVRPRQHGAVLPLGFVEQLTEAHHVYSESLRDAILALAAAAQVTPTASPLGATSGDIPSAGAAAAVTPAAQAPVVPALPSTADAAPGATWSPPVPSMALAQGAKKDCGFQQKVFHVPGKGSPDGVDESLLLQVADGI